MNNSAFRWMALASILSLFSFAEIAAAQIPTNAVRTVFLSVPNGDASTIARTSVAYHPVFDQYYVAALGTAGRPGYVHNSSGTLIHTQSPLNIDPRSINFNPNTELLEVVTYKAISGGSGFGLIEAELDAAGLFTGGTATLLSSMPGNDGPQTLAAYDPTRDRFYSRHNSNNVNIVSRADGSLLGTITLDFAAAGVTDPTASLWVFHPPMTG